MKAKAPPPLPFYRNPRLAWAVGSLVIFALLVALFWKDLRALVGLTGFGWDFVRAILSLAFVFIAPMLARNWFDRLVSQFVMPVHTLEERREAYRHFQSFSSGLPGPAMFIKDGQIIASESEKAKANLAAGVILVDNVSGVVLRTDTEFRRAEGPGVVFTLPGEYIAGEPEPEAIDLRKQFRVREQVKARTRDGIEIKANIGVIFMLDSGEMQQPRSWKRPNQTPFAFSRKSALKAFYNRTYRDDAVGEWAEIPPILAADVWREVVSQYDFQWLFNSKNSTDSSLSKLQKDVLDRLTCRVNKDSPECQMLDRCGIRVLGVSLAGLELPLEAQKRRLENWREEWLKRAGEMSKEKDPAVVVEQEKGKQAARRAVLELLTRYVRDELAAGRKPTLEEVIVQLTEETRQIALDRSLNEEKLIYDWRKNIYNLVLWARRLETDQAPLHSPGK